MVRGVMRRWGREFGYKESDDDDDGKWGSKHVHGPLFRTQLRMWNLLGEMKNHLLFCWHIVRGFWDWQSFLVFLHVCPFFRYLSLWFYHFTLLEIVFIQLMSNLTPFNFDQTILVPSLSNKMGLKIECFSITFRHRIFRYTLIKN